MFKTISNKNYKINKNLRNRLNPLNPYCRANNVSIEAVNEHVHSEEQLSRYGISTKDSGYYIKLRYLGSLILCKFCSTFFHDSKNNQNHRYPYYAKNYVRKTDIKIRCSIFQVCLKDFNRHAYIF